ncbi:MAG: hypothetical protein ACRDRH_17720 [Pseudonocardia sp.]
MTSLHIPDPAERDDLGAFTARVVRLDRTAPVRLSAHAGRIMAWAPTPFDVLATRSVRGTLDPQDVTVGAAGLLTALAVERSAVVDPGPDGGMWLGELPPFTGWTPVGDVSAVELERLIERGLAVARENAGQLGPPASLLDQTVLTVRGEGAGVGGQVTVKVPLRCLFALSGMGFLGAMVGGEGGEGGETDTDVVRISATGSWLRLDARFGAVVRRRITTLPLVVA